MTATTEADGNGQPSMSGMVSVIIPTFNRAGKVMAAVRSALDQTYTGIEVLVVDDGSTDDTRKVVEELGDERIRYLFQENAGLPVARNRGMAESRGDYVAFLDSDDTWLPWKLQAQVAVLAAFPQAGMVWTNMAAVDEDGRLLNERYLTMRYEAYFYLDCDRDFAERRPLERLWTACPADLVGTRCYAGSMYRWMFLGNLAHDSTVLLRRDRQQATGEFDPAFEAGYEFFLRASEHGEVAFVDADAIHYQIGAEDQMTAPGRRIMTAQKNLAIIEKALASSPEAAALPEALIRERIATCHYWIGQEEFFHDPRSARRHFAVMLSSGPLLKRNEQWRAFVLYVLTFLPRAVLLRLRRAKRAVRPVVAMVKTRRSGDPAAL